MSMTSDRSDITYSTWLRSPIGDATSPPVDVSSSSSSSSNSSRIKVDETDEMSSKGWILARRLEPLMRDVMDSYLYNVRYQPDRCSKLAKDICEVIKVGAPRAS